MSRSSRRAGVARVCAVALTTAVLVLGVPGVAADAADGDPGATLVKEPWPGHWSETDQLTPVGDRLFFSATDGSHGQELWVSDGTPERTRMVRDIRAGSASARPQGLVRFGDRVLFTAYDTTHGRELWVSDGTKAGTRLVRDIRAGRGGGTPEGITVVHGIAYFAATEPTHHWGLWRTDGTRAGTRLVRAMGGRTANPISGITRMGSRVYFVAGTRLWRSDGTAAGTTWLSTSLGSGIEASAISTAVVGKRLYVSLRGHTTACCVITDVARLIRTDGTRAGTKTVVGGYETGPYWDLTPYRGRLYFIAPAANGHRRLWVTRGTASTTDLVRPKVFTGDASGLAVAAGRLYFATQSGYQLWSTDGSAGGERRIGGGEGWAWSVPGQDTPDVPVHMVSFEGRAWFEAATEWTTPEGDGMYRGDVWSTDGTLAGTRQETALDPGASGSVWALVRFADGLWFAGSVERRDGLWQVDDRTAP